jgi:hypothetical protein
MNTASVQKGAEAAVERGLIEKIVEGNKTTKWRAIVSDSKSDTQAIQNLTRGDSKSESLSSIKESIKKERNGATAPKLENLSIENQVAAGVKQVTIPDNVDAERKDTANLVAMGCPVGAYDLVYAFLVARDIKIPNSKVKGQRKAVREMLEMGVKPEHVTQAVYDLLENKMTIVDMFGVSKTAINLANQKDYIETRPEYKPFKSDDDDLEFVARPK